MEKDILKPGIKVLDVLDVPETRPKGETVALDVGVWGKTGIMASIMIELGRGRVND